jgi:preprotein translocase subunit SecY
MALGLLAVFPYVLLILSAKFPSLPIPNQQIQIGGTSLLILVSVALETLRQIESKALMLTYDDYSTLPDVDNGKVTKKKFSIKKVFTRLPKK